MEGAACLRIRCVGAYRGPVFYRVPIRAAICRAA